MEEGRRKGYMLLRSYVNNQPGNCNAVRGAWKTVIRDSQDSVRKVNGEELGR